MMQTSFYSSHRLGALRRRYGLFGLLVLLSACVVTAVALHWNERLYSTLTSR